MTTIPRVIHHLATNIRSEHLCLCTSRVPDLAVEDTSLVAERVTCAECRRIAGLGPRKEPVNIVKTTYTVVVLHRADRIFDSLDDAWQESYDGDAVGNITAEVTVPVADADVPAELIALGNDGEFFLDRWAES